MYFDHRIIPHTTHIDLIPEVPEYAGGVVTCPLYNNA